MDFQLPVALVDRSDSRSIVMAVDRSALKRGIYPGLPYANAIALCPELHAVYPHPQRIEYVHQRVIRHLGTFSPKIEPVAELPGAYYLDVSGMHRLEPNLQTWAQRLQGILQDHEQLHAKVAIGFTRFGVRAAVHSTASVVLFESASEEIETALSIPLEKLNLPSRPLMELDKLGIHTVGDLQKLSEWEVRSRFSEELFNLIRKAKEEDGTVHGIRPPAPYYFAQIDLDYAEGDVERILAVIRRIWNPLLEKMKELAEGVSEIHLRLTKDFGGACNEKLRTAKPTLDQTTLIDLLRLRLHAMNLDEGVVGISVHVIPGVLPSPQMDLYQDIVKSERNLLAANRALARICAEFGPEQVLRARCLNAHLPEDSYEWEYFDRLRNHASADQGNAFMVRRILDDPNRISTPRRATLEKVRGPYSTTGFWWRPIGIHRNDYFVETSDGCTQWIFYDCINRQWYERGFVQ